MSGLSTHILDTAAGKPASGVLVRLFRRDVEIFFASTNADGRIPRLLPEGTPLDVGVYRLLFEVADYFAKQDARAFYPEVAISFEIHDATAHYHVPLLISPYGYTTYRGS